jgi:hypothetical protein
LGEHTEKPEKCLRKTGDSEGLVFAFILDVWYNRYINESRGTKMYRLKATLGTKKKWIHLVAENDSQAIVDAVGYILSEATTKEVWAKGAITLTNPSGEVIKTMESKV